MELLQSVFQELTLNDKFLKDITPNLKKELAHRETCNTECLETSELFLPLKFKNNARTPSCGEITDPGSRM